MSPDEAVKFMIANKIVSLKTPDGLEVVLHPEAFLPPAPATEPAPVEDANLDVVGSAGMTRRQQIELLGVAFEGDFKKKRV